MCGGDPLQLAVEEETKNRPLSEDCRMEEALPWLLTKNPRSVVH